jgi:hypothetical protein
LGRKPAKIEFIARVNVREVKDWISLRLHGNLPFVMDSDRLTVLRNTFRALQKQYNESSDFNERLTILKQSQRTLEKEIEIIDKHHAEIHQKLEQIQ